MGAGHVPAPLGPSVSPCLPSVCSAQADVESSALDQVLIGSGDPVVAPEGVVRRPSVPVGQ